ncbi:hypothetical protein PPL_10063 [Heterostelium album PN500]|uniref:Uncharacterized protein n=1 Tax=Heterostelium pallidum (strain ATCC 26659 / Pp 5 / PN500) TaxID=670386 RepID=D3BQ80_HETP5|nr:hypothetical protein PPL_10063 [Heterostelium album PN500]EFA76300.1 hypothetical protein PPL_10063 [Heterostelium album PN500]|eukprot:XP_020428432.1 hypothetical protein PPL_10063 [Heterostelium album PN500]
MSDLNRTTNNNTNNNSNSNNNSASMNIQRNNNNSTTNIGSGGSNIQSVDELNNGINQNLHLNTNGMANNTTNNNNNNLIAGMKTHFGSPLRTLIRASSLQNLPSHGSNSVKEELPSVITIKNQATTTKDKMDLIKYDPQDSSVHPGPSSKYDFVKVKVRLEDHYYVLSRFLISRVLNVTQVDAADSVKISLELKKRLVDQGRLTLTQSELENELFTLLQSYGYGAEYIERYRMNNSISSSKSTIDYLDIRTEMHWKVVVGYTAGRETQSFDGATDYARSGFDGCHHQGVP